MKRYMFFLLFSAWLLSGSEIKLSRQALPRSNSIRIGDVNITVDRDDSSPSKWTIHARRGAETRKVAVTRGGTDHGFPVSFWKYATGTYRGMKSGISWRKQSETTR